MRAPAVAAEVLRSPETEPGRQPKSNQRVELGDLRFRALMSEADWASLPLAIRRRFSKRLAGGQTIVYAGEILESWMSRAGWWLAQAARLIGGPLPLTRDAQVRSGRSPALRVASVVTVTEDMATGGQIWTRLYARRKGFPQVIHSSKRFAGPTGLEEYVGRGIGGCSCHRGLLPARSTSLMPSFPTASSVSRCRSSIRVSACSSARWRYSGRLRHDLPSALDLDLRSARARAV